MFKSSIKIIKSFPAVFGPYYLKDLLSMFSSTFFWKSIEVVLEEKLILRTVYLSMGSYLKCEKIVTVLAVPESPQNIAGFLRLII